jgi:phage terminase Nu1 subunit (DNA packaging protein)
VSEQTDQLKVQAALEKQRLGKELSSADVALIQRMRQQVALDELRRMSPKMFCSLFGIQHNQRNLWEEQLNIPCGKGRETIDLFAVAAVLRKICGRRAELAGEDASLTEKKARKVDEEIRKLQEQIVRLRTENELQAGLRLRREEIIEPLERMASIIRGVGEKLARKGSLTGRDAQQMLNHAVDQYERELAEIRTA